ncbi:MAG: hypothetical protein QGG64_17365 [Candidatus Latescibacteria bacterium]|jgi:hypothetical protein|nr:hypothetical protein [Candidatus Latescibacterota bacterium]
MNIILESKTSGYDGTVTIDLENATGDPVEIAREALTKIESAWE